MKQFDIDELSAKNIILTILHAIKVSSIPVKDIIAVTGLLGITENNTRVALSRMVSDKKVKHDGSGNYQLSNDISVMREHVNSWRNGELRKTTDWNKDWIMCRLTVPASAQVMRKKSLWALDFLGFKNFFNGLWLRPDNLLGGIETTRDKLFELGLEQKADVATARQFSEHALNVLLDSESWGIAKLEEMYRNFYTELSLRSQQLESSPRPEDVLGGFIFGYRIVRALIRDPFLPNDMHNPHSRKQLTDLLLVFEIKGRKLWDELVYNLQVS